MKDCQSGNGGKYDEMVCVACENVDAKVDLIRDTCDNQTAANEWVWEWKYEVGLGGMR